MASLFIPSKNKPTTHQPPNPCPHRIPHFRPKQTSEENKNKSTVVQGFGHSRQNAQLRAQDMARTVEMSTPATVTSCFRINTSICHSLARCWLLEAFEAFPIGT